MRSSSTPFRMITAVAIVFATLAGHAEAATYRSIANVKPGHVAWIYRQPDVASPRVGYLKSGAFRIRTLGCKQLAAGGWCQVMRRGTRGWVQDRFLKAGTTMRG